jgi:hypothetical protein
MFAILGNYLFSNISEGDVVSDFKNFQTFFDSFLLLFILSTGESWNIFMFDCSRNENQGCQPGITCGTFWAFVFFPCMVLICSWIMLNLFILVIIQQFEKYYLPKENMITRFKNDQQSFMVVWNEMT